MTEGTILETKVGDVVVKVTTLPQEKIDDAYARLKMICQRIDTRNKIDDAILKVRNYYQLETDDLTKSGINSDYHRVMLSLIFNFNQCMGATDVSNDWGGINTGNVSRVFTGSKESTEKYIGHFEKCIDGKYRFTEVGLKHALDIELPKLLV